MVTTRIARRPVALVVDGAAAAPSARLFEHGYGPFTTALPDAVRLEQLTFLWMVVPCLCAFSGKRKDTRQSAFTFPDGFGRGKVRILRVMSAAIPGHIATLEVKTGSARNGREKPFRRQARNRLGMAFGRKTGV